MKVLYQVMPPLSVQKYAALNADIAGAQVPTPTAVRQDKSRKVRPVRWAEEEKRINHFARGAL